MPIEREENVCNLVSCIPDSLVKSDKSMTKQELNEAKAESFCSLFVKGETYSKEKIIDILIKNGFRHPRLFLFGHIDSSYYNRWYFEKVKFTNGQTGYRFSWTDRTGNP